MVAGRRTNLALLALLIITVLTGVLSWAIGSGFDRWIVAAHGIAGLAIIVLVPWKSVIARRGLARGRPGTGTSIAFGVLVVASIGAGLIHITGIVRAVGPLSPLGIHVATGVGAIVVGVAHVVRRPVHPHATDLSRRNLLRGGAVLGAGAVGWLSVAGALRLAGAPGADRRLTGSFERGSGSPSDMPVTQWLNDPLQEIDPSTWRLQLLQGTRQLSVDDLAAFGDTLQATLDCTGGWYAEQVWSGVRLDHLLDGATGDSILVRSVTGYSRRFPLSDASGLLLSTHAEGELLSSGHGAPARLVAPGRRGFWWVKWVSAIDVDDVPWWWGSPFPLT